MYLVCHQPITSHVPRPYFLTRGEEKKNVVYSGLDDLGVFGPGPVSWAARAKAGGPELGLAHLCGIRVDGEPTGCPTLAYLSVREVKGCYLLPATCYQGSEYLT